MIGIKYFNLLNLLKKAIVSVLKHFFASFCLKYLVPTISVISVMDLWSVIRIYKKGSIKTLLRSFYTCQARQLLHGAVIWFCTKLEYNTTKSGFWGKLALFNVISERYRTCLIYIQFLTFFWEWCKNFVDQKYISFKTTPGIIIWQSHG